ncbi:50S ribosomal protein L29 [Aquabacterium sp.]|uniref:50S ribosomal protein L29 n=1 Tax=Aquabacterium sp. TaxID=1872578 RepID=UPI003D6C8AC7
MNASELRAKDVAALETEVKELLKAHFNMRMQKATQQLNDHSALKKTRRDIARVKTILTQKTKEGAAK